MNLKKLLGLCCHKWVETNRIRIVEAKDQTNILGYAYHLKCEKCGYLKKRRLMC